MMTLPLYRSFFIVVLLVLFLTLGSVATIAQENGGNATIKPTKTPEKSIAALTYQKPNEIASGNRYFGYSWPFDDRDLDQEIGDTPVFVELYSDEACQYCSPADLFTNDLVMKTNLIIISCHVDNLGFVPDSPLLASGCFDRQGMYTARLWKRKITPDFFINGKAEVKGYLFHQFAEELIRQAKDNPLERLNITKLAQNKYTIPLEARDFGPTEGFNDRAYVTLFEYQKPVEYKIPFGPNEGRRQVYHNVVSEIIPLMDWKGQAGDYQFTWTPSKNAAGAVIIFERKDTSIFAVGEIKLDY